jgi:hypothetical protein
MIGPLRNTERRQQPTRRVILLGASNLVRSLSTVVETVRQIWREPVEIMAAIGHGRSYGQDSRVLGRKISGIFPCTLWEDLHSRPSLPTFALVTDVGNDLLYGNSVEQLSEWVERCLDRLSDAGATTIVTQLPIDALATLGTARFMLFRALLFPKSRLTLSVALALANEVNARLTEFASRQKTSVIPVSKSWYGFDPIHVKRRSMRHAWPAMLAAWRDGDDPRIVLRASVARWAYVNCLAPSEWSMWGVRRRAQQPCGEFSDGTTLSLY